MENNSVLVRSANQFRHLWTVYVKPLSALHSVSAENFPQAETSKATKYEVGDGRAILTFASQFHHPSQYDMNYVI